MRAALPFGGRSQFWAIAFPPWDRLLGAPTKGNATAPLAYVRFYPRFFFGAATLIK